MLSDGKVTDVRLTDFDVILTRGDVFVSRPTDANCAVVLPFAPLGLEVARGYAAIDATLDGVTYRIVGLLRNLLRLPSMLDSQHRLCGVCIASRSYAPER